MNVGLSVVGLARRRSGSGYANYRTITIDHTKVPSTQTNIPILISLTGSYLKTVANGGSVTSSSGYDIILSSTTTSNGSGKLSFEIDTYDGVNGIVNLWVKIPSLSSSSDTVIYLLYGNAAITSSQENIADVWSNGYTGVWHFGNGSSLSLKDSVTGATSTPHGSPAAAAGFNSGGALALHGSVGEYIDTGASYDHTPNITFEGWVNMPWVGSSNLKMVVSNENGTGGGFYIFDNSGSNRARYYLMTGYSENDSNIPVDMTASAWQSVHCTMNSSWGGLIYVNGSSSGANTAYQSRGAANGNLLFGYYTRGLPNANPFWFNGSMDELRMSNIDRSADWITTQYNNVSSSSTFYKVTGGYSSYKALTVQAGQVTGTLSSFPMMVQGTYSYLKTMANGGQVTNANGYDIIFSSTPNLDGSGIIPFEIESYNATTGAVVFHVNVSSLAVGTVIYMLYGNAAITTTQANPTAVWDSNFVGVYHLDQASNAQVLDSTGHGNSSLSNSGQSVAGPWGNALGYTAGSSQKTSLPNLWSTATSWTFSGWVKNATTFPLLESRDGSYHGCVLDSNSNTHLELYVSSYSNGGYDVLSTAVSCDSTWHYCAGTWVASVSSVIVDGNSPVTTSAPGAMNNFAGSGSWFIGEDCVGGFYTGNIKELRVSNIARSTAWLLAEYSNQKAPSSFYTVT